MTANPWDKFFWNDWETDPALKLCSLAAQGLWMRMLCLCAKADPKGYLLVAGQPLSPADLASLAGKPEPEVVTLLSELSLKGVFSTDRIGRIYNRKMVRQVKKARTARENGSKGGNPTLSNQSEIPPLDKAGVKPPDKPHKPISIIQEPDETSLRSVSEREIPRRSKARVRSQSEPERFPEFWEEYPRKVSRSKAVQAFASALSRASPEIIIAGAKRYAEARRNEDPQYTAHASSWLNQDRWLDQLDKPHGTNGNHRKTNPSAGNQSFLEGALLYAGAGDGGREEVSRPGQLALTDARDGDGGGDLERPH